MVTMRSPPGDRRRERVEQRGLARAGAAGDEEVPAGTHRPPEERRRPTGRRRTSSSGTARAPNRRMVTHGPSMASGGMTAWRREPSGSRASTIGDARSRRRPSGPTTRSTSRTIAFGVERERDRLDAPVALDVGAPGPVQHHLGDVRIGEQRFERTQPRHLVGELADEPLEVRSRQERVLVAQELHEPGAQRVGVVAGVVGVGAMSRRCTRRFRSASASGDGSPASGATVMPQHRGAGTQAAPRDDERRGTRRGRRAAAPAAHRRRPHGRRCRGPGPGRSPAARARRRSHAASSERPGSSTSTAPVHAGPPATAPRGAA